VAAIAGETDDDLGSAEHGRQAAYVMLDAAVVMRELAASAFHQRPVVCDQRDLAAEAEYAAAREIRRLNLARFHRHLRVGTCGA
jgi:hypothetical protein